MLLLFALAQFTIIFPNASSQSNYCFGDKVAQYTNYMTKKYIVITIGCHTIQTKPSLRWLHNEPLSILQVSVRCPPPCLIRGGNNSVSRSCCTNACFPSPLPCLRHRLTKLLVHLLTIDRAFCLSVLRSSHSTQERPFSPCLRAHVYPRLSQFFKKNFHKKKQQLQLQLFMACLTVTDRR